MWSLPRGIKMKRLILLLLFCFTILLSACSQSDEDTQEYSGIIGDEKSLGYAYTVTKEQNKFSWEISYKGDIKVIEESTENKNNLESFKSAVNDSQTEFITLIISLSYLLIVVITTLVLYKKNRKMLKDGGLIIIGLTVITIFIVFETVYDLNGLLQEVNYHYSTLAH